jgi:septal ring factor EnvC (AmiA/AmiB activator)
VNTFAARCLLICLGLVVAAGVGQGAADNAEAERRLEALRDRIAVIEREQREAAEERDSEAKALRQAEEKVAERAQDLEATRRERRAVVVRRDELAGRRSKLAAALEDDIEALGRELRAAWLAGREPRLKLVLSQRDPARLGRMLAWYRYVAADRSVRIGSLREGLAELAEVTEELAAEQARLLAAERRQERALAELEQARAARADRVAALNADLARREQESARLREEAAALEQLLEELRAAVADLPVPDAEPFPQQQGRLDWPVEGELLRAFGSRRGDGPPSKGIVIGAERGSEVRAVWSGRVAYADWLPGLGLLLVLEHGDGFMSLYGHNEALFSAVGDWVGAGQVIARVGDSGGRDQAGLYFEVRNGMQPENPQGWLRRP